MMSYDIISSKLFRKLEYFNWNSTEKFSLADTALVQKGPSHFEKNRFVKWSVTWLQNAKGKHKIYPLSVSAKNV